MKSFLEDVAEELYEEYRDDISSLKILAPNRRAELFFKEALTKNVESPVWSPEFISLQQITAEVSGLTVADNTRLIIELYKIYSQFHNQSLDAFYFWGDVLLADFDAIDKYRINADMLYSNIEDMKKLDADFAEFDQSQLEIIRRFSQNLWLDQQPGREKELFIAVWKTLPQIYHKFRESLLSQGIAYDGMAQRITAERIESGEWNGFAENRYVVLGFNALTACEKVILSEIKKSALSVRFFWDYDDYYYKNGEHQAGIFMRDNVPVFKQKDSASGRFSRNNFSSDQKITVVTAPSDAIQCKYVYTFLKDIIATQGVVDKRTAIVLADENLLLPVLYSLPEDVGKVNITMGYPLKKTIAYALIERLINLQRHKRISGTNVLFYHKDVIDLLTHPYLHNEQTAVLANQIVKRQIAYLPADFFKDTQSVVGIFRSVDNPMEFTTYITDNLSALITDERDTDSIERREFLRIIIETINKLSNSLIYCNIELSFAVMYALIRKLLQPIRIPYEGEPLEGVQIMGVLETRNLDFRNVIILSVCDDVFPGNRINTTSFIPQNLRYAYGLPTPAHHDGVYAYYFYRMIQRAENVVLAYSSLSDDKKTGEPSRYIYQLKYSNKHKVEHKNLSLNVTSQSVEQFIKHKDQRVMDRLMAYCSEEKRFSPTSILSYMECPMKFCLRYVEGIKPMDEVVEDVDMPTFGIILHKAMELLYAPMKGIAGMRAYLQQIKDSDAVIDAVNSAIDSEYYCGEHHNSNEDSGNLILVKEIVLKYINDHIIPYDIARPEFVLMDVEHPLSTEVEFKVGDQVLKVGFKGSADRVDILNNGNIGIVDYKTGKGDPKFIDVENLFNRTEPKSRNRSVLQTLIYAKMISEELKCEVEPSLYFAQQMGDANYEARISAKADGLKCYLECARVVDERLKELLSEIFDQKVPFVQTEDKKSCEYCDFKGVCRR